MASQTDLFGYYKPPVAISVELLLDDPGCSAAGQLTVTVRHHRPTPAVVMVEHLDEYEAHELPAIVRHLWMAWEHPNGRSLERKFREAVTMVRDEYVH